MIKKQAEGLKHKSNFTGFLQKKHIDVLQNEHEEEQQIIEDLRAEKAKLKKLKKMKGALEKKIEVLG